MNKDDEFAGQGGRYVMREGKRVRVEESTQDHPEGNTARDAQGRPVEHATSEQIAAREKAAARKQAAPAAQAAGAPDASVDGRAKKGAN